MLFALQGVALYAILAGADFGAGIWQLLAGRGERAQRIREHAHHSMAPVWEANHVWLIFVLVVVWTGYPVAFASMASTLAVALTAGGPRHRPARRRVRAALGERGRRRAARGRHADGGRLGDRAVRARGRRRRDRVAARAGRQRGGRPVVELAEPDVDHGRRCWRCCRAPTSRPSTSPPTRAARATTRWPRASARARSSRARSPGVAAIAGALVVRSDARWIFDRLVDTPAVLSVAVSLLAGDRDARARLRAGGWARRGSAPRSRSRRVVGGWALAQNPVLLPGPDGARGRRARQRAGAARHLDPRRRPDPVPVARRCCSGSRCAARSAPRRRSSAARRSPARPSGAGRDAHRDPAGRARASSIGAAFLVHRRQRVAARDRGRAARRVHRARPVGARGRGRRRVSESRSIANLHSTGLDERPQILLSLHALDRMTQRAIPVADVQRALDQDGPTSNDLRRQPPLRPVTSTGASGS